MEKNTLKILTFQSVKSERNSPVELPVNFQRNRISKEKITFSDGTMATGKLIVNANIYAKRILLLREKVCHQNSTSV